MCVGGEWCELKTPEYVSFLGGKGRSGAFLAGRVQESPEEEEGVALSCLVLHGSDSQEPKERASSRKEHCAPRCLVQKQRPTQRVAETEGSCPRMVALKGNVLGGQEEAKLCGQLLSCSFKPLEEDQRGRGGPQVMSSFR